MKRLLSAFLAVVMVVAILPVVGNASASSNTCATNDYTPFLIESVSGKAVYNANTANMCYRFYLDARTYIQNNAGVELNLAVSKFSFDYNGITYTPESVYVSKPDVSPSCGLLTGIINFEVGNSVKHIALVAFQGTDGFSDAFTDAVVATGADGYHEGFQRTAQKHYEDMLSKVTYSLGNDASISFADFVAKMRAGDTDYTMIVTGHSLGAAVAGVFTSKYLDNSNGITAKNAVAYTFASPLTCSYDQAAKEAEIVKNVFNILNTDDVVIKVGADVAHGTRTGYDFKYRLGVYDSGWQNIKDYFEKYFEHYFDPEGAWNQIKDIFDDVGNNHHMGTAYLPTKNYINSHVNEYTKSFVIYDNYEETTRKHQRIIFNNGQLIVIGSGVLAGNWRENTLIDWAKVKDDCNSLVFDTDCSITEIGDYAFAGMAKLSNELILPVSITRVGEYAFFQCGFAGKLNLRSTVESVGAYAFSGCSSLLVDLSAITIKDFAWGLNAFKGCNKLALPADVKETQPISDFGFTYYYERDGRISEVTVNSGTVSDPTLTGETYNVESGSKIYCRPLKPETYIPDFVFLITTVDTTLVQEKELYLTNYKDWIEVDPNTGAVEVSSACPNMSFRISAYPRKTDGTADITTAYYYIDFKVTDWSSEFAGGEGTKDRPYLIETCAQFERISKYPDKYYKLIGDIGFEGRTIAPLGTFTGQLDGNGYAIYGFNISASSAGLFNEIAQDGYVKNLTVGRRCAEGEFSATISSVNCGSPTKAGVIACVNRGIIDNCSVIQVKVETSAHYDWSVNSTIQTVSGGMVAENYGTIKSSDVKYSKISASSTTTYDNNPASCEAFSGGVIGINWEVGIAKNLSSISNTVSGYTYSVDEGRVPGDGWAKYQGRGYTYCGGVIAESLSSALESSYSYNTLDGNRVSDGGTTSNEPFVATGTKETINCLEHDQSSVAEASSINVDVIPYKANYLIGEALNVYGMAVSDNNGKTLTGYTVSGYDSSKPGVKWVTVSYKTGYSDVPLTVEFPVYVEEIVPVSVVVQPKEPTYDIGDTLSNNDFAATVYYNDGTTKTMESLAVDGEIIKFDAFEKLLDTKGTQVLQLSYRYGYLTTEKEETACVAVEVKCDCKSTTTLNTTPATVSEYGYTGDLVCTSCGSIVEAGTIIEKLECTDHNYNTWEKYDDLQHCGYCACGEKVYANHEWDAGVVTIAPTHFGNGEITYTCTVCDATKTDILPAPPHIGQTVEGYAADCTNTGLTDGVKCSVCGEILTAQEVIPATGHSLKDGTCTVCGYSEYVVPTISVVNGKLVLENPSNAGIKQVLVFYTGEKVESKLWADRVAAGKLYPEVNGTKGYMVYTDMNKLPYLIADGEYIVYVYYYEGETTKNHSMYISYPEELTIGVDADNKVFLGVPTSLGTFSKALVFYVGEGCDSKIWADRVNAGKQFPEVNGTKGYKVYTDRSKLPMLTAGGEYILYLYYTDDNGKSKSIDITLTVPEKILPPAPNVGVDEDGNVVLENVTSGNFSKVIVSYAGSDDPGKSWNSMVTAGKKHTDINGKNGYKVYTNTAKLPTLTVSGKYVLMLYYTEDGVSKNIRIVLDVVAPPQPGIGVDDSGKVFYENIDNFSKVIVSYAGSDDPGKSWNSMVAAGKLHTDVNDSKGYQTYTDSTTLPTLTESGKYVLVLYYTKDSTTKSVRVVVTV